jgi:hypothetical protein
MTQKESAAYLVKASTASNLAINKEAMEAQKKGDFTRVAMLESTGANLDGYVGEKLMEKGATQKLATGIKSAKARDEGEAINPELNKILVAMGATNKYNYLKI